MHASNWPLRGMNRFLRDRLLTLYSYVSFVIIILWLAADSQNFGQVDLSFAISM
jgi:hypothetical protein